MKNNVEGRMDDKNNDQGSRKDQRSQDMIDEGKINQNQRHTDNLKSNATKCNQTRQSNQEN